MKCFSEAEIKESKTVLNPLERPLLPFQESPVLQPFLTGHLLNLFLQPCSDGNSTSFPIILSSSYLKRGS